MVSICSPIYCVVLQQQIWNKMAEQVYKRSRLGNKGENEAICEESYKEKTDAGDWECVYGQKLHGTEEIAVFSTEYR